MSDPFRNICRDLTDEEKKLIEEIKAKATELHDLYTKAQASNAFTREMALAKTKLEESVLWVVKHVTG